MTSAPATSSALAPLRQGGVDGSPYALVALSTGGQLVASTHPDPATADGYLRLTAHLLLQAERRRFRSVGVISAVEGEGKTAAAINLAVCLGRTKGRGGRVLLVDADSRHRTLTRIFCGPDARPTPADPTAPEAIAVEPGARHPMLLPTAFDGVDLLTAPESGDGLTLESPAAWIRTLDQLDAAYEHVVIDCPTVLDNPEGIVLRDVVEQLVLVIRAGRTPRRLVERAIGDVGHRVLGVILNGAGTATVSRVEALR